MGFHLDAENVVNLLIFLYVVPCLVRALKVAPVHVFKL